jgi:murein DD-endopeptidase MepM/ murein hydrolase activator NlpD
MIFLQVALWKAAVAPVVFGLAVQTVCANGVLEPVQSLPALEKLQGVLPKLSKVKWQPVWPVVGAFRISSRYGVRYHPIKGRKTLHKGVDIAAARGTAILAIAGGVVEFAGWRKGYGRVIDIRHTEGRLSRYAHIEKILIKAGQFVLPGHLIATVGRSGSATGDHLHLEVLSHGEPLDPLSLWSK